MHQNLNLMQSESCVRTNPVQPWPVASSTGVNTLKPPVTLQFSSHHVFVSCHCSRKRLASEKVSQFTAQIAQMEQLQASLVEQEDFEQAAALDLQMAESTSQRDQLQAAIQQVDMHVAGLADRRAMLVAKQAEACDAAAKYLARLQSSHGQLMDMLSQRAAQEAASAEAAISQHMGAIENGRAALAQRKVQLAAAREDTDAKVRQATGSAAKERAMLIATHAKLQVRCPLKWRLGVGSSCFTS